MKKYLGILVLALSANLVMAQGDEGMGSAEATTNPGLETPPANTPDATTTAAPAPAAKPHKKMKKAHHAKKKAKHARKAHKRKKARRAN